jgi:hypothetical protein
MMVLAHCRYRVGIGKNCDLRGAARGPVPSRLLIRIMRVLPVYAVDGAIEHLRTIFSFVTVVDVRVRVVLLSSRFLVLGAYQ